MRKMQWQTQLSEKKANTDYIARYGVYAVIPNPEQKQIVLVQEPNGAWFYHVEKLKQVKIIRKP
ncbi:mutT/nudix family protein [Streptococcus pneumoniae]|nr:mutT/nudix family protein [Streptococcus pneumoniae]